MELRLRPGILTPCSPKTRTPFSSRACMFMMFVVFSVLMESSLKSSSTCHSGPSCMLSSTILPRTSGRHSGSGVVVVVVVVVVVGLVVHVHPWIFKVTGFRGHNAYAPGLFRRGVELNASVTTRGFYELKASKTRSLWRYDLIY